MQSQQIWFEKLQAETRKINGELYLIQDLVVNYTKPHNEAAMLGGPQTRPDYNVLKVTDLYQPSENKEVSETIILLSTKNNGERHQKIIQWGLSVGLRTTTPHVPFAIGENLPNLNYSFGLKKTYVVETTGCVFNGNPSACGVWWEDDKHLSDLRWQRAFALSPGWLAFRKSKM